MSSGVFGTGGRTAGSSAAPGAMSAPSCVDVELVEDRGEGVGLGGEGQVEHADVLYVSTRPIATSANTQPYGMPRMTYPRSSVTAPAARSARAALAPTFRYPTACGFAGIDVLPGGMHRNGLPGWAKAGWNFPFTIFTNAKQPLPCECAVVQLTGGMNPMAL